MMSSRGQIRRILLALLAALLLVAPGRWPIGSGTADALARVQSSPAPCAAGARPTPAVTEGPFYKSGSPERTSLVTPAVPGTRLALTGYVCSRSGKPIPRAWLDFWQADSRGKYDNADFRLRGHQFADGAGRYTLETIVPGEYPGRTPHIHVKVRVSNQPILTTQLYFPGLGRNQADAFFRPELVLLVRDAATGKVATFNFVLDVD